jgi:hypothetical protein
MRATFCAAALLALIAPCFAKTAEHQGALTIVYRFEGNPSEIAFRELRSEMSSLLRSSSITPEWRDRRSIRSRESFENLVVVSFHGRCKAGMGDEDASNKLVLGHSPVTEGQVQPFIDIECESIEAILRNTSAARAKSGANAALGRALARVLAHELYHVLAQTTSHAKSGIAKPSLSETDLMSASFAPDTKWDVDFSTVARAGPSRRDSSDPAQ